MTEPTLLSARGLNLSFGPITALADVEVDLWPGEMLAIVGESGSGKTTLLNVLSGRQAPDTGVVWYRDPTGRLLDVHAMPAPALRTLHRSDWGFVHQDPRQNLRMAVSAGGNVGERLMAQGARHYGDIREAALAWLAQVEIDASRIDEPSPAACCSASRSPAPWSRTPAWSSWTSRPAASTSPCRPACSI
jgi:putative phosphonate transport system ATP-binding protein